MNGLDKIINDIIADADGRAQTTRDNAKAEGDKIISRAESKAQDILANAEKEAEVQYKSIIAQAHSKGQIEANREILNQKHSIIDKVLESAYDKITNADTDEYFAYLEKLLSKVDKGEGTIIMSNEDIARMPESFKTLLDKMGLKVSQRDDDLDGGFIIVRGDIEENCSISALMADAQNVLYDTITEMLF